MCGCIDVEDHLLHLFVHVGEMDDTTVPLRPVNEFRVEDLIATFIVEYAGNGRGDIVVEEQVNTGWRISGLRIKSANPLIH